MKVFLILILLALRAVAAVPTVTVENMHGLATSEYPYYTVLMRFSTDVTGLTREDFTVTNGTVTTLYDQSGSFQWSATVVVTAPGASTFTVPAGVCTAITGGESNTASGTLTVTWVDALPGVYTPPIGIPEPSFGIAQNATTLYGAASGATYDYQDDGGTGAVAYRLTAGGDPYTYYIDPGNVASTDTSNIHGTVAVPRKTFPTAFASRTMARGKVIPKVRLKPGDVVIVANTGTVGVPLGFGFTSGYNSTTKDTANDSIGIGTKTAPIFIRGVDPNNRALVRTVKNDQEMPCMEYVIWENILIDTHNYRPWPYSYGGTFPPPTPFVKDDGNFQSITMGSYSNHCAFRNCEMSGRIYYDFRYKTLGDICMHVEQSDHPLEQGLHDILFYRCKIGPNAYGADEADPLANFTPEDWTSLPQSAYKNKTYPWREVGVIGLNIGNNCRNIWVLDCDSIGNGDTLQIGEATATKGKQTNPPERIFVGGNRFWGDQENNVDIKGGVTIVVSGNGLGGTNKSRTTSDGLPYQEGVNYMLGRFDANSGGGGGQPMRINDEGLNRNIWVVNNYIRDAVQGFSHGSDGFTNGNELTYRSWYVIGNLMVDANRDAVMYDTFHGNTTDSPTGPRATSQKPALLIGESESGDGWGGFGVGANDCWFVNNTIDRCARGVYFGNMGDFYCFNNIISNRLYDVDPDGWEDPYLDMSGGHKTGTWANRLHPNIVYPVVKRTGIFTTVPQINSNPAYVDDIDIDPDDRDYRLSTGSPAINTGYDPGAVLSAKFLAQFGTAIVWKDRAGVTRGDGGAWDIGAYEYSGGAPPAGTVPANTGLPVVTGTATEGQTLTATLGSWTGSPTPTYAYQWVRAGADISGATASTYPLAGADVGSTIRIRVTASNTEGSTSAMSAPTAAVAPYVPPAPSGGTATAGTVSAGTLNVGP